MAILFILILIITISVMLVLNISVNDFEKKNKGFSEILQERYCENVVNKNDENPPNADKP